MNAESMSSKECVALPKTSESIRIQAISYTNDATAVPKLTARSSRDEARGLSGARGSSRGGGEATEEAAAGEEAAGERAARNTTAATRRFRAAAASTVPGRPATRTSQNPLSRPPTAAPRLLAK